MRSTRLVIDTRVLRRNAERARQSLPENVKLMAVVKSDAYGHSMIDSAKAFLSGGADGLCVALAEEAITVREAGIYAPLLILGSMDSCFSDEIVTLGISQAVYSLDMLMNLQKSALKLGIPAKAHLKIDTGMTRIGVRGEAELEKLLDDWDMCPNVQMEGMFTHFCVADTDPEYTMYQNNEFHSAVNAVRLRGYSPVCHAAASEAYTQSEYQYDMVRPGIALYGEGEGMEYAQTITAKPIRIETIHKGDTVGYGREFTANRDTVVMTVPIGYGDGYRWGLSNKGACIVNGEFAPLIGRVCMDMTMFDVTDISGVNLDSEITLLGSSLGKRITPDDMAKSVNTIPYEIMLGFTQRLRREIQ